MVRFGAVGCRLARNIIHLEMKLVQLIPSLPITRRDNVLDAVWPSALHRLLMQLRPLDERTVERQA